MTPTELYLYKAKSTDKIVYDLDKHFLFSNCFIVQGKEYFALLGSRKILFFNEKMEAKHYIDVGRIIKHLFPEDPLPENFRIQNASWDEEKFIVSVRLFDGSFMGNPHIQGLDLAMTPGKDGFKYEITMPRSGNISALIQFTTPGKSGYNVKSYRVFGSNLVAKLESQDYRDVLLPKVGRVGNKYFDLYDGYLLVYNHLNALLFEFDSFDPSVGENRIQNLVFQHKEEGAVRRSLFDSSSKTWHMLLEDKRRTYRLISISFSDNEIQRKEYSFRIADGYVKGMHHMPDQNSIIMPLNNFHMKHDDSKYLIYFVIFDLIEGNFKMVCYEVDPKYISISVVF